MLTVGGFPLLEAFSKDKNKAVAFLWLRLHFCYDYNILLVEGSFHEINSTVSSS